LDAIGVKSGTSRATGPKGIDFGNQGVPMAEAILYWKMNTPSVRNSPAPEEAFDRSELRIEAMLFIAALALRSLLLAAIFWLKGDDWAHFHTTSDAGSFLSLAKVIYGVEPVTQLSYYDTRVFPGWPLIFGWTMGIGLPDTSMLLIAVVLTAMVPMMFYRLTGDRTLAWYLVYFPPAWLVVSTLPMSEPAYLVAILAGLLAVKRARPVLAGAFGGGLVVIRAFGVAWLGAIILAMLPRDRKIGRAAVLASMSAAAFMLVLLLINWRIYGDPIHQVHVYARPLAELNIPSELAAKLHNPSGHWGWPFENLLLTPWRTHVPAWKIVYIYAHIPAFLFLAWQGLKFLRSGTRAEAWQTALVLGFLANLVLILCSGPYWGFESFDRYFVWGLPGAIWLARPWLSVQPRWHLVLFPLSLVFSVYALFSHLPAR
jgi:hypothetical protein